MPARSPARQVRETPRTLPLSFKVKVPDGKRIFIAGLGDAQAYRVKINRQPFEVFEAGRGGILLLENPPEEPESDKKKPLLNFDKRISIQVRAAPSGPTLNRGKGPSLLNSRE